MNNYKEMKQYIKQLNYRPSILLHSCCAPCSSQVIIFLNEYFDITIFYSNDNIYPLEEFELRLNEEKRLIKELGLNIKIIDEGISDRDFYDCVKGLENLGERSRRCYNCYRMRLEKTAKKAHDLDFDYFTTTLSISPYKNADWINEIGFNLENRYKVKFLYSDFKKDEGYKKSIELSHKYNLYRQNYCGCIYSYLESVKKNEVQQN